VEGHEYGVGDTQDVGHDGLADAEDDEEDESYKTEFDELGFLEAGGRRGLI